jgi:hypothetical protein
MAEVTLRLRYNPTTGQRELVIGYESDDDALPHEHERDHRALAESILGVPLGDASIVVERVAKPTATEAPPATGGEPLARPVPTPVRSG